MKKYLTFKNLIKAIIYVLSWIFFPMFTYWATLIFLFICFVIVVVGATILFLIYLIFGIDLTESRTKD